MVALFSLPFLRVSNGENGLPLGRALFGLEATRTLCILTAIDLIQTDHITGKGIGRFFSDLRVSFI